MKKAIAAGALLVLMLALSLWHIHALDTAVGAMTEHAERCRAHCRAGDMDAAEDALSDAEELWGQRQTLNRILLRQTETDAVEAAISQVLEALRTDDRDTAEVALDRLERQLASTAAMEHITWEAIF